LNVNNNIDVELKRSTTLSDFFGNALLYINPENAALCGHAIMQL